MVPAGDGADGADLTASISLAPDGRMTYTIKVTGNDEEIDAAHIHMRADDENGDVVVELDAKAVDAGKAAKVELEPDLAERIIGNDGSLNIPKDIDTLGWWVGSRPMGATKGTTLIAGYVDSAVAGLGYFAKLTDLAEGDPITVVDGLGEKWEFEVSATEQVVKSALPEDLFDTTGERRLALIPCGGEFDEAKRSYVDNYVVYATPVRSG